MGDGARNTGFQYPPTIYGGQQAALGAGQWRPAAPPNAAPPRPVGAPNPQLAGAMPSASLLQMMQNAGVVNSRPNGTFGTGAAGVAAPRPATLSGGALPAAQQPSSQLRFMQAVPAQPQLAGYGLPAGQAQVPRPATTFAPLPASRSGPVTFRPPIYASSVANRPPSAQPMGTVSPALLSMSGQGAKKADVIDLTGDTDVVPSARAQPSALPSTEEVVYGVVRTKVRNVVWDAYLTADAPATNEEPVFVMQNPDQKTTLLVNNIVGVKLGTIEGLIAAYIAQILPYNLIKMNSSVQSGFDRMFNTELPIQIVISGALLNQLTVTTIFNKGGIVLHPPNATQLGGRRYLPPQRPEPARQSYAAYTEAQQVNQYQQAKNQLDDVYDAMRGWEDLEETHPSEDLVTKTYPHQRQALTFMLQREQDPDERDGGLNLWRKSGAGFSYRCIIDESITRDSAVRELRGGLVADDMGLGKTIQIISLIVSDPDRNDPIEEDESEDEEDDWDEDEEEEDYSSYSRASKGSSSNDLKRKRTEQQHPQHRAPPPAPGNYGSGYALEEPKYVDISDDSDFDDELAGSLGGADGAARPSAEADDGWDAYNEDSYGSSSNAALTRPGSSGLVTRIQLRPPGTGNPSIPPGTDAQPNTRPGGGPLSIKIKLGGNRPASPASASASMVPDAQPTAPKPLPTLKLKLKSVPPPQSNGMTGATMSVSDGQVGGPALPAKAPGKAKKKKEFDAFYTKAAISSRGTLIVCPLSTVTNWEEQIQQHCRPGSLDVYIHHGSARTQDIYQLAYHHVVITTYNVLSLEYNRMVKSGRNEVYSNGNFTGYASPLHAINWHRVVLDEAHTIKETSTAQSKAACSINAVRRWCLSGTPIQNKLDDLYALVKFLRAEPFDDKNVWTTTFTRPLRDANPLGVSRLQTLMKLLTIRRTKTMKIKGKPILTLPPREDRVEMVELSSFERQLYDAARQRSKEIFDRLMAKGVVMRNYMHVLEILLRLRQIVTHPSLVRKSQLDFSALKLEEEDVIDLADDSAIDAIQAWETYNILRESGEDGCCRCEQQVADAPVQAEAEMRYAPVMSRCMHLFCKSCMEGVFKSKGALKCNLCGKVLMESDMLTLDEAALQLATTQAAGKAERAAKLHLKSEKAANGQDEGGVTGSELMDPAAESAKVRAIIQDLSDVRYRAEMAGEELPKSIIFSQWTSMLDVLEVHLEAAGFYFARLDGRMTRADRTSAIQTFRENALCTVMLVSLKAGGVGLNLTMASRAYLVEPYWNPAVEHQAVDRIHRMGQTRPVTTIRLIVKDSVEENIMALQQKKLALANMALERESKARGSGSASQQKEEVQKQRLKDLKDLFK